MPIVKERALVAYSAQQMFALVADVESYPQFVPWCVSARKRVIDDNLVEATLGIGKGPVNSRFTTRNVLDPYARIQLNLMSGPFKHLEGHWSFIDTDSGGSSVSLELEFEISGRILQRTLGPLFNELTRRMVGAFTERAQRIYGDR